LGTRGLLQKTAKKKGEKGGSRRRLEENRKAIGKPIGGKMRNHSTGKKNVHVALKQSAPTAKGILAGGVQKKKKRDEP